MATDNSEAANMAANLMSGPAVPPHAVLDPTTFPKVYAEQQPSGARAAFADFYPNGLPMVYNMYHGDNSKGVARDYVENNLPLGFYTNRPADAAAVFSTMRGTGPFREMEHLLPQRRIHLWGRDEIQSVCNSIRMVFWDCMKQMKKPYCWDDLWNYFDAYDLYHYGSLNLWNVINHLFDENVIISVDVQKEYALHIGKWANDWLIDDNNKAKLIEWNEARGMIFAILSEEDRASLGGIQDDVVPLIASALKARRASILQSQNFQAIGDKKPTSLVLACEKNELENWLGMLPVNLGHYEKLTSCLSWKDALQE